MAFELPKDYKEYFVNWEKKIDSFIKFDPQKEMPASSGAPPDDSPLKGLPFAVSDNIAVEGFGLSCGSKMLDSFKVLYSAAAVEKLAAAGAVPVGKTNIDEFGICSAAGTSALKKTNNPWDVNLVPGGASGGSAAAVASGLVPFALGADSGGSVRQPAALCGIAGLKPTYGAVSRYGLSAVASSLETVGVFADSVSRCRRVFDIIRGEDSRDQTSAAPPKAAPPLYGKEAAAKGRVIGVLSKSFIETVSSQKPESEVIVGYEAAKAGLSALGFTIKEVDLPCVKYASEAYHIIAYGEASSNLARFDGIRYGMRPAWADNPDDLMDKARIGGFGDEIKLLILAGTYVLRSGLQDEYYLPACRIREGIKEAFEALLGDSEYKNNGAAFDALLFPVFPARAFAGNSFSPLGLKAANLFTSCVNLAGLPALSFPAALEGGLPVGVQLIGRSFAEGTILDIAGIYEKANPFPHPQGYKQFFGQELP